MLSVTHRNVTVPMNLLIAFLMDRLPELRTSRITSGFSSSKLPESFENIRSTPPHVSSGYNKKSARSAEAANFSRLFLFVLVVRCRLVFHSFQRFAVKDFGYLPIRAIRVVKFGL